MMYLLQAAMFIGIIIFQTSCGNMSKHDIESISQPGYCKNEFGQDLTVAQCNTKMAKDTRTSDNKSESDKMIRNINDDLKKENKK